ncbi:MAG: class III extradiol ring-cleavage dioxygenase [Cyanobacteria bacterium P01_C01_bin.121]
METANHIPSLFVSHGAPDLPLSECSARDFLSGLADQLPQSRAILVISPHWMTSVPTLRTGAQMRAIHDFGGFSPALSQLRYDAPGFSSSLQQAVLERLEAAQLPLAVDPARGLDHGAWVPLLLMYPQADIPVAQLSLPAHWAPSQLVALGEAISPLRKEGVLILSSGSATHNLWAFGGRALNSPTPDWVAAFEQWLIEAVERGDLEQLMAYSQAPYAKENHPTPEHLLPLFIAMGAGGRRGELLHRSYTYEIFSMAAFSFA